MNIARLQGHWWKRRAAAGKARRSKSRKQDLLRLELLEGRRVLAHAAMAAAEPALGPAVVAYDLGGLLEKGFEVGGPRVGMANAGSPAILVATTPASDQPVTVPGKPTQLKATVGNDQVTLTWAAPESDGGAPITDYVIEFGVSRCECRMIKIPMNRDSLPVVQKFGKEILARSPLVGFGFFDVTTYEVFEDGISSATSVTLTGLTPGQAYSFRVTATNSAGRGLPVLYSVTIPPKSTHAPGDGIQAPATGNDARSQKVDVHDWRAPHGTTARVPAADGIVNAVANRRSAARTAGGRDSGLLTPIPRGRAPAMVTMPDGGRRATGRSRTIVGTATGRSITIAGSSTGVSHGIPVAVDGRIDARCP